MRDPYSLLGVKKDAGADEIKAAWRSKAKSLHPDHNQDDPSATKRFAEVGQAYEVLKDPDRRRRYDTARETHQTIMQQREATRQAEERAKAARANAEKVMEELARANAQRAQAQASATASANAGSTSGAGQAKGESPEDMVDRIFGTASATSGGTKPSPEQRQASASGQAQGQSQSQAQTGSEAGAKPESKPEAAAAAAKPAPPLPLQAIELIGTLLRRIRGESPPPEKAPDLLATAKATLDDMLTLNVLTVTLSDEREIRLPLEAGMTDGQEIRLKGQGLRLQGMQRGDLVVTLRITRDPRFVVEGHDLHTVLSISLEDAVLGGEHEVETPGGKVPVSVPAWSGSDQSLTVPGLGLLKEDGERGDLIVELRVILWEKPDEKIVDLMRHMRHGLFV
ncbi:DnaJ C-terminal domain-containing protein [Rhizobium sp. FY34]|uniref:J domain-containing protein n=1 Tax=Rhizobium sp. FY34 TaxID=2562309 RepID=UPI0010BF806B|nr:DnaJ C-terminal domain-containing protein [Rhizobium sp. FY34]